jgi:hypothetical protein
MKFAGGFAVLIASCLPLAVACGSPESPNFFSERGGSRDPGAAGRENAHAGSSEGGTTSAGGNENGGTGDTSGQVAGRPGMGSAGKNGTAGRGGAGNTAGAESGGTTGSAAGAGGAGSGSGGKPSTGSGGSNGGASGAAGSVSAGSGGTAGAHAGSGGSASGSGGVSGGSGSSGSSGSSGWGWGGWNGWGGSNSGGAAGASACPANPPTKNDACDVTTPDSCFYSGLACSCLSSASGPGPGPINPTKRWACYGDGALCPDTKPTAGASCKGSVDAECPYPGNDYCVCSGSGGDAHWVCQANPPTCSANKPVADNCSTVKTCSWGTNKEQACFCNGSRWGCEGGF